MAKPQQKPAIVPKQTLLDDCEAEVRAQLELIAKRREETRLGFDRDMAMATAALCRALVSSEGERRQQAKMALREVASIPLEQVLAYLRTLAPSIRADLARDLTNADAEEPLL